MTPGADRGTEPPGRTDHERALLAGAATGHLSAAEAAELDGLLATDAAARRELAELDDVVAALAPLRGGWDEAPPSPGLAARVLAATGGVAPAGIPAPRRARGRTAVVVLAALALVAVGAVGGVVGRGLASGDGTGVAGRRVPGASGPAGTLGAVEPIALSDVPAGVTARASVVAHTWGTETLLDVEGLPAGRTYTVVVVDAAGQQVASGGFVASSVPVDCALNAPVLRAQVRHVEVLDAAGTPVISSDLPRVRA